MSEQTAAFPTRGLGRKIALATVLGVLVFAALSLYGDVQSLQANLRQLDWRVIAPAVLLATLNYALRFVRWHYYLGRLDIRIPAGESALVFTSGFVMSITPGKVGEVFKSLLLFESRGISIARTAPIVIAERLTDLAALVLLTALGTLAFERGLPVAVGGAAVVLLLLLVSSWRALGELTIRIVGRLPLVGRLAPRLHEAYDALFWLTRPTPLVVASALSVVSWFLECASLWLIVGGFPDVSLSWAASTFAYSAPTIAGALTLLPGGLGVTEAGMTGVLQALGGPAMTPAIATATTMLVRLATLWWAVVLGLGALLWWRRVHGAEARRRAAAE